ncbi:MAG TPA: hypothetical protein V6C85_03540 [Allocoleopsis sp.]
MSTDNFAKSMQQKLATASDTEQVTKAEGLDSMTGELEDSELEAVAGGIQTITVSGPTPDYVTTLMRERDGIATKYAAIFQNANF